MAQVPPKLSNPALYTNQRERFDNTKGGVYAPRSLVRINNFQAVAPCSWEIEANAHGATDSATVVLPISNGFDLSSALTPGKPAEIVIYAGFPANPNQAVTPPQLTTRFAGIIDQIEPYFDLDEVKLSCRSLGAILTAQRVTTAIGNPAKGGTGVTTTQFVQQMASQHGLNANIVLRQGQAAANMTQVFGHELVFGLRTMRQWDLLVLCAEVDNVDIWVSGNTLNYVAPDQINRDRLKMRWGRDLLTFHGTHAPQFSKNIEVEVRTYSPKQRVAHTVRTVESFDPVTGAVTGVKQKTTSRVITQVPGIGQNASTSYATSLNDGGTSPSVSTSVTNSVSTGGMYNSGFTKVKSEALKEHYVIIRPNLTPAAAQALAMNTWKQLSMHEYVAEFSFPMTPATLPHISITTLYEITGLPWKSFDTQKPESAYRPRRVVEKFGVSQSAGGTSDGWTVEVTSVSHALPQGAV